MVKSTEGKKRSPIFLIATGVLVLGLVFGISACTGNTSTTKAMESETIESIGEEPPDAYYVRISKNGKEIDTLYAGENTSVSHFYYESSQEPYEWPEIDWGTDTVTLTVWGNPTVKLLTTSTKKISLTRVGSSTVLTLSDKIVDTISFTYVLSNGDAYEVYFSVA